LRPLQSCSNNIHISIENRRKRKEEKGRERKRKEEKGRKEEMEIKKEKIEKKNLRSLKFSFFGRSKRGRKSHRLKNRDFLFWKLGKGIFFSFGCLCFTSSR
jgi:hypothetical protein